MTFDLTSSEALQLIRNDRNEEHTEQLFIAARPNDCTFNGTIKRWLEMPTFSRRKRKWRVDL